MVVVVAMIVDIAMDDFVAVVFIVIVVVVVDMILLFLYSLTQPTGPSWSSSSDVHHFEC